jgi:hypothetical protein
MEEPGVYFLTAASHLMGPLYTLNGSHWMRPDEDHDDRKAKQTGRLIKPTIGDHN